MSPSKPQPIHQPHREIRSQPDENEPSFSYERDSFLQASKEFDVEDEFHQRLQSNRRDSGGSFWRTASDQLGPASFQSMKMNQRNESIGSTGRTTQPSEYVQSPPPPTTRAQTENSERSQKGDRGSGKKKSLSGKEAATARARKDSSKQRTKDRLMKMEAQNSDLDLGHLEDSEQLAPPILIPPTEGSVSRSSSDHSGSLLYGKTRTGVLLGKSSSLIFPTGVEAPGEDEAESVIFKRRKINLLLDQCETVRFPFKKKLILDNMQLSSSDIPVNFLCGTPLGNTLHKLSLNGNTLSVIPPRLVQNLPNLKQLDLSQCGLVSLPQRWNLPLLKRLTLSHNRITEFPDEAVLEGLPELQELNMYGNKVSEIIIPRNPRLLSRLETLNLGYNDLGYLPEELDQLKVLKVLKVMNNFLEKVPMRICDMDLRSIDVSSNPVIQPPQETCDRGICSMKRYYDCLRKEEQSKHKAVEEVSKKLSKKKSMREKKKFRAPRFLSPKSASHSPSFHSKSSVGSDDSSTRTTASSIAPRVVKEEPLRLPSKTDKPGLDLRRKRSVSFDAGMGAANKTKEAGALVEAMLKPQVLPAEEDLKGSIQSISSLPDIDVDVKPEDVTVNDTLKVIFVGMAMAGKTSMIKRLIEGKDAVIPQRDDRTIGVDIYEWDPRQNSDRAPVDTKIELDDKELAKELDDQNVKFSVWDFAGQHVYHATHELFFSPRSLYVLVWDMGATNKATHRRRAQEEQEQGPFRLSYDSSDDEDEDDFQAEEEARRADRALERDIDEKVQFWVECIQSCTPGAAILPVATFDDYFDDMEEAKRRCNAMKQRLRKHEERRLAGINGRLKEYLVQNRANDEAAIRLQKLLCPYTRPKLIFGDTIEDSVVRVSGTKYTGFDTLTQKIVAVSTGRDKVGSPYPIFRGHVGARIPRMRLEVREAVRSMRDRFKVVEWGHFLGFLKDNHSLTSVEDISDALHFLTNIGELSYFGNVFSSMMHNKIEGKSLDMKFRSSIGRSLPISTVQSSDGTSQTEVDEDDDDDIEEAAILSIDDTSVTMPSTRDDGSFGTFDDQTIAGLSQYVFLNPRWLVAAVACILRHDLDREIKEMRRSFNADNRSDSFYKSKANLNCPVITAEDAKMLWQAKKFTKRAADRAQEKSVNMQVTPFDFLQRLLVRFGVFVPIDLSIEKALLGGKEYARVVDDDDERPVDVVAVDESGATDTPQFFFLPSLLGPGEPAEAWTYKNTDSWKTTLCHSILFPDGVPPGLMERITAAVLSSIYAASKGLDQVVLTTLNGQPRVLDGPLRVKEMICWRTAFYLKLGTEVKNENGDSKESIVEIFVHLADRESHLCVGSDDMSAGMRRLVVSGKGQVGDGGRKIWSGGYLLVIKAVGRVMTEYEGLEFEKHGFCPECLSKVSVCSASHWDWAVVRTSAKNGDGTMRCRHGHRVDTRLITGPIDSHSKQNVPEPITPVKFNDSEPSVPVQDLLRSIVLVGLWDGKSRKVVRVGSGFVVDKKRGLIVTASHTLMNIWGDKNSPFGENYYGLREGKVVVGVIRRKKGDEDGNSGEAVFRYFASIVAKDPSIEERGECHLDACVLQITTRMENDVAGNGDGCGDQPEMLLQHNPDAMKREKLQQLKMTDKCELDEQVRILGYNQGGEGLLGPGESLNRFVDFARGYVCKKFATGEDNSDGYRHRFKPREEIVVICPTIGGHSGGPCVNQQGEVVGILSRADPTENQRCYLVPTSAWKALVKKAKNMY